MGVGGWNYPYEEDMTPIQAAFAVFHANLRPIVPENCPLAMKALIEQCWSAQPEKRPEFWQIVKVLEQFESSLATDGTLNPVQNSMFLQGSQDCALLLDTETWPCSSFQHFTQ
ncbi:hypothetical protein Leryth_016072, partial [Lithospermum erythrorhizon]